MSISFWKGNPHESGCIPMVCNKDFNLLPLRELDDKQDFYIRLSTLLAGFGDKEVSQLPFYLWLVTQNLTDLVATRLLSIRYNHKGHFWTWFFTIQHQPYRLNKIKLVEGVGVEPTYPVLQTGASTVTANLPLKIFFFMSRRNIRNYLHIVNRFIRYLLKYLINFLTLCKNWWARKDLNFQTPKRTLLQSAPLPVTGYLPIIKVFI